METKKKRGMETKEGWRQKRKGNTGNFDFKKYRQYLFFDIFFLEKVPKVKKGTFLGKRDDFFTKAP